MHVDTLIVGHGIAGGLLAWHLRAAGQTVLVLDDARDDGASRVATGLVNPVAGKRMVIADDGDKCLRYALHCYQQIQSSSDLSIVHPLSVLRVFVSAQERDFYRDLQQSGAGSDYFGSAYAPHHFSGLLDEFGSVEQKQVSRIDTRQLLATLMSELITQRAYCKTVLRYDELRIDEGRVEWRPSQSYASDLPIQSGAGSVSADRVVFCEGSRAFENPWFRQIPYALSKGEALVLRFDKPPVQTAIKKDYWFVPLGENRFSLGSTYEWEYGEPGASRNNREVLLAALGGLFTRETLASYEFDIAQHQAGLRPVVQDRAPVAGFHPEHPNVAVLNGLGSKGLLWGPCVARSLTQQIVHGKTLSPQVDVHRFFQPEYDGRSLVQRAHELVARHIQSGDIVVDATMGNGYDTLYLAQQVGAAGRVYAFDIQADAFSVSSQRLREQGVSEQVALVHASHCDMAAHLHACGVEQVQAVMFNLGYRPGGDKTVTTRFETTRVALRQALNLIGVNGIITLLAYVGHAGGKSEAMSLLEWLEQVDRSHYAIALLNPVAVNRNAPLLVSIVRES